jgi:NADPH-dependent glutamate synthase beta subunit-like oxidoreductase
MQWGIPSYVLPDQVAERPIKMLLDAGVKMRTKTRITPEEIGHLLETHDAVIAAYGAPLPESPRIPGVELHGVIDATTLLTRAKRALADGQPLSEIKCARVLVLGGSNTAIDAARSVLRLGGKAIVVHRREERFSRARPDEIAEAKSEGVEFRFATTIARIEGEDGKVERAVLVSTRQQKAGSAPVVVKGSEQVIEANVVVLATGYCLDPKFSSLFGDLPLRQPSSDSLLPDRKWQGSGVLTKYNVIGKLSWEREYGLRTSGFPRRDRVWLIGDALMGPATVVGAMAQGRLAARSILERRPRRKH